MKAFSTLVLVTVMLLAAPTAGAKDDDLQVLEYQFNLGRGENPEILEAMQEAIEKGLKVAHWDTFKGGEDCVRLSQGKFEKGERRGRLTYVCSTSDRVYSFMTKVYYGSLDVKSPVNDVAIDVRAAATSCSIGGCAYPQHPGRQPCILVTEQNDGVWCRHSPYTAAHNCVSDQ